MTKTDTRAQVRRATQADLPVIVPLFDEYRVFYGQRSDPVGAHDFLTARLRLQESVIFLAVLDGVPAGFTQLYPSFTSIGLRRLWILNDMYVAPLFRRRGVSTALLDAARLHGLQTGAARLVLSTEVGNLPAQATYEAHGWQRETRYLTYELELPR